jgi:hypothetical protein
MRVKVDQELIDTIARLEVDSLIEGLNDEELRTNPQFLAKVRQFLKENDVVTTMEEEKRQIKTDMLGIPALDLPGIRESVG